MADNPADAIETTQVEDLTDLISCGERWRLESHAHPRTDPPGGGRPERLIG